jgi:hypothetical protein
MPKPFQKAARFAFSQDDWILLTKDPLMVQSYAELSSVADVERFVFTGNDQLKQWREQVQETETHDPSARQQAL